MLETKYFIFIDIDIDIDIDISIDIDIDNYYCIAHSTLHFSHTSTHCLRTRSSHDQKLQIQFCRSYPEVLATLIFLTLALMVWNQFLLKVTGSEKLCSCYSKRRWNLKYLHVTLSVLPIDLYWRAPCHLGILICIKMNSMPYWSTKAT